MVSSIVPPIIAHRGASGYAPENTLAAFRKAQELGLHWIEFDVMLAKCGEVVVIHDESLHRTTSGQGKVADHTFEQLKNLDAGSWFNSAYSKERILSLTEMIYFLAASGLRANIELKPLKGQEEALVKKVTTLLRDHQQEGMEPLLISSFSLSALTYMRQYNATAWLGFLMDSWHPNWQKICDDLNCLTVNVNHAILDANRVKSIRATQRLLLAYTVNSEKMARDLFALGVDAIFTDYPDRMLKVIGEGNGKF